MLKYNDLFIKAQEFHEDMEKYRKKVVYLFKDCCQFTASIYC